MLPPLTIRPGPSVELPIYQAKSPEHFTVSIDNEPELVERIRQLIEQQGGSVNRTGTAACFVSLRNWDIQGTHVGLITATVRACQEKLEKMLPTPEPKDTFVDMHFVPKPKPKSEVRSYTNRLEDAPGTYDDDPLYCIRWRNADSSWGCYYAGPFGWSSEKRNRRLWTERAFVPTEGRQYRPGEAGRVVLRVSAGAEGVVEE